MYFTDRLQGEPHDTMIAVVVFARHVWPSETRPVQRSPAWGDDFGHAAADANGWAGLSDARRVVRANDDEFALPDRSYTLVVMADLKHRVPARAITVPRMLAPPFPERWLQLRVLVGLLRSAFGGSRFVSRHEAWTEQVCALPAVRQFVEQCEARAR